MRLHARESGYELSSEDGSRKLALLIPTVWQSMEG